MKKIYYLGSSLLLAFVFGCNTISDVVINTSQVFVPEEGGINFIKVTDENVEQLIRPNIIRTSQADGSTKTVKVLK